ncbi:DUF6893 family small protein [Actinospica acidithermotolerans]
MLGRAVKVIGLGALVAVIIRSIPDLKRYLEIREM